MRRVYKFRCAKYGEAAIREKRLKVSRLSELNDPFDCRGINFPTPDDYRQWEALLSWGSDKLQPKLIISCFNKCWQNPVMWAHYAERGKVFKARVQEL